MSMPVTTQQPPPAVDISQNSFASQAPQGAIGPLIAVLIVILILGIAAVMIGRICSGRKILGYGHYDIESWAETHCGSCIDGRISPRPLPQARPVLVPEAQVAPQVNSEIKNEEEEEDEDEDEEEDRISPQQ